MTIPTHLLPVQFSETLLDSVPSAFFTLDQDRVVTFSNRAAANLVHRTPQALLGVHLEREFGALLSERWFQSCQKALTEQDAVDYEIYNPALGIWVRVLLTPFEQGLAVHLQDITETRRMEQLQGVSAALATFVTPEQVIGGMLDHAVSATGAYMGALFHLSDDGQDLELLAEVGYPAVLRANASRVAVALGYPPCEAARTHQPVFVSAEAFTERFLHNAAIRSDLTRSLASVPLMVEGKPLGVLALSFREERRFGAAERQFILGFTQQCAQALDRVRSRQASEDSRERLAFLAEASVLLSATLDVSETIERLGQLTVKHISDWVTVFLPDTSGHLQFMGASHRDPAKLGLLHEMMFRYPLDPEAEYGVMQVYRTGTSALVAGVPEQVYLDIPDLEKRRLLRALNLNSLMTVPLVTRGQVIGAMCLAASVSGSHYTPDDLQLAEELARRAAGTIENAQLYAAARDDAARLTGIISTVSDAVVTTDEEGRTLVFNTAAERMFGVSASDVLGQSPERFLPVRSQGSPPAFSGEPGATERQAVSAVRADGNVFPVEETASQVFIRGQRLVTSVLRDVSGQIQAEKILRDSEERFRATFDQAAVGIAHLDLNGRWHSVNHTLCTILGYSHEELLTLNFIDVTHQDDIEADRVYVEQLLSGAIRTCSIQKRYLRKNQTAVWVNVTVSLVRNEDGEAQYFIAVIEDISDIKQAEVELRAVRDDLERRVEARTAELQVLSEQLKIQVGELEHRNHESHALAELSEMLQACFSLEEVQQVVAKFSAQLLPSVSGSLYSFGPSKNVLEEMVSWNSVSQRSALIGPNECWGLRRGRPFVTEGGVSLKCRHVQTDHPTLCMPMLAQGETVGLLYLESVTGCAFSVDQERLARTVSEMVALAIVNFRLRESLRQQSIRDPLTELFNRRYLEETFDRELRRAQRSKESIGMIMLDIDHFKVFNDSYGHEAGDALLKELGQVLRRSVRGEDVACRYGGEEFALLLSGADLEQTMMRAEQIRLSVQTLKTRIHEQELGSVSASLGVAAFPQHGTQLADLMRAADLALYRAKNEGRNRVLSAS